MLLEKITVFMATAFQCTVGNAGSPGTVHTTCQTHRQYATMFWSTEL